MSYASILFEIGGEELPPKSLLTLATALQSSVTESLANAGLAHQGVQFFAAPRRLAIHIKQLATKQADRELRVDGPPVKAAFDADGKPTQAALGFAKKNGVDITEVDRSGEKLVLRKTIAGADTQALLPAIFDLALKQLPIAKRMRWGASRVEFVRPMHWLVLLADGDVIPATILGLNSGRLSYGHRFHHPQAITLAHADDYLTAMRAGFVVADFAERRQQIETRVHALAAQEGGRALMPAALLDEVTALVEWPVPLVCQFESRFLAVPQEALISTMQDNQKYFCLVDGENRLLPRFITVANVDSPEPERIISGNEKVVRPRLTDAEFFFQQDKKQSSLARNERLKQIIFQAQLGTVYQKAERIAKLAGFIAKSLGGSAELAEQAGLLCKSDLVSEMVSEFPELQGIAGYHYALHDGLDAEIATAIMAHYQPRFAGDALPATITGLSVSLADKVDTLIGLFGIGQPPTGSKDPFALRRAALGVLRILIHADAPLTLTELVNTAAASYPAGTIAADAATQVQEFLMARYRAMYEEQGVDANIILAVQAVAPTTAADFDRRIHAVAQFSRADGAIALAAANKRVANILSKADVDSTAIHISLLVEPAEQALAQALAARETQLKAALATANYTEALSSLAELRDPVDNFFNQVMVNADDDAIRQNRLALLSALRQQFIAIADISLLN